MGGMIQCAAAPVPARAISQSGARTDGKRRLGRPHLKEVMPIQVDSEIGRLRRVLVHRPGLEIDRMPPSMMEQLLFDDILYGDEAREEHDLFSQVMRQAGVLVLDGETRLAEVLREAVPRS